MLQRVRVMWYVVVAIALMMRPGKVGMANTEFQSAIPRPESTGAISERPAETTGRNASGFQNRH